MLCRCRSMCRSIILTPELFMFWVYTEKYMLSEFSKCHTYFMFNLIICPAIISCINTAATAAQNNFLESGIVLASQSSI